MLTDSSCLNLHENVETERESAWSSRYASAYDYASVRSFSIVEHQDDLTAMTMTVSVTFKRRRSD
jgi:hypothetical protein